MTLRFLRSRMWLDRAIMAFGILAAALTCASSQAELPQPQCAEALLTIHHQAWLADYPNLPALYQSALKLVRPESNTDSPTLSIVIPAYKEAQRIGNSIGQIRAFFDAYPYPVEILIRVEKSPDDTVNVATLATEGDGRVQVAAHEVQRGKGYAVRQGMLRARGDYVIFMDADLSTPLPEIYRFLAEMAEHPKNADVIIGDRRDPRSRVEEDQAILRQLMGLTFRSITKLVLSSSGLGQINDTQCGFKLYTRAAAQSVFQQAKIDGFAFDVETLILAAEMKFQIASMPVLWRDDPRSTVNKVLDPIKMLVDILSMRRQVRKTLSTQTL